MIRTKSVLSTTVLLTICSTAFLGCGGTDLGDGDEMVAQSTNAPSAGKQIDVSFEENVGLPLANAEREAPMEIVSLDQTPVLREAGASITNARGTSPALVVGSLAFSEADGLAPPSALEKLIGPASALEGLALYDSGEFTYKSGLWGTSYDVVVSKTCSGSMRDSYDAYAYNNNGGYCSVVGWYTQDPSDCRFIVHVGASKYKSGICAWSVYAKESGVFSYSTTNTSSAQQNTTNATIYINAGQTLTAGTCGLTGASASGDTYLRLFDGGAEVAQNDDACGGLSSNLVYTSLFSKKYELRAGCYGATSCSGNVVFTK